MTKEELKPCPFCGGEADRSIGKRGDGSPWHYVECLQCAAMADSEDAWNRRQPSAEGWLADVRELLRRVLEDDDASCTIKCYPPSLADQQFTAEYANALAARLLHAAPSAQGDKQTDDFMNPPDYTNIQVTKP